MAPDAAGRWTEDEIKRAAKARVEFKMHLLTYLAVNVGFVVFWFLTADNRTLGNYWPIWIHAGWGLGVVIQAFNVYVGRGSLVEREEKKLREKHGGS